MTRKFLTGDASENFSRQHDRTIHLKQSQMKKSHIGEFLQVYLFQSNEKFRKTLWSYLCLTNPCHFIPPHLMCFTIIDVIFENMISKYKIHLQRFACVWFYSLGIASLLTRHDLANFITRLSRVDPDGHFQLAVELQLFGILDLRTIALQFVKIKVGPYSRSFLCNNSYKINCIIDTVFAHVLLVENALLSEAWHLYPWICLVVLVLMYHK